MLEDNWITDRIAASRDKERKSDEIATGKSHIQMGQSIQKWRK